jgi:hypothetical protein
MERDVKQVAQKIGGPRAEGWFLAIGICQKEREMRLKATVDAENPSMVSKGWQFGGRRDRQRPEEGKLGRVVVRDSESVALRSSKISKYDQEVQLMRNGYVRFVWVEANETQIRFLFTGLGEIAHHEFTELSSCRTYRILQEMITLRMQGMGR